MTSIQLPLEKVWADIRAGYDTTFLEELMSLPGARVLVFGGLVRESLLGNPWKDIDMRIILTSPKDERNTTVENIFKKYGTILEKVYFSDGECMVLRANMPGTKGVVVDSQTVSALDVTLGDFTVSSIFLDLKTGELLEQVPGCFSDFEHKIIRPAMAYDLLETYQPYTAFRALKIACQTGFNLHAELIAFIKENRAFVDKPVKELLQHLKEHGKTSYAEFLLGNIFSGLKVDPVRYVTLLSEYSLFSRMCEVLQEYLGENKGGPFVPRPAEDYAKVHTFEEKISLLLSDIAHSISKEPQQCFEKLKAAFALDTDRSDGKEFVITSEQITFTL